MEIGKVVVRETDDWIEIYLNGNLIAEGHSLSATSLMDALSISYETVYVKNEDDWFAGVGVPKEVINHG